MSKQHPKADFLKQLASETEHGLLFVAEKMAASRDIAGMHAVLDAIVAQPQKLFQDNVLVNTVGRLPAGTSYADVFAELLKPDVGRSWNEDQRDFYERLLPLIEPTQIVLSLSRQLMHFVDDLALIEGIGANRTVSLVDKLTEAIEQGNVLVAAKLIAGADENEIGMALSSLSIASDHQFMYSVNSGMPALNPYSRPVAFDVFARKMNEGDESRQAVMDVIDRIEVVLGTVPANNFRMRMVEAEIDNARYSQAPVNMSRVVAITGNAGEDVEGTVIEIEFRRAPTRKDFDRVDGPAFLAMNRDPAVSVAKAALESHALPLIQAAWPIFAKKTVDPMVVSLKSPVFYDVHGFQETLRFLDQKAKEWTPPAAGKGLLQRIEEFVISKIPAPPKRLTLTSAMHYLAENPEIEHWQEKMGALLKMGADPSSQNYAGFTPAQLIPASAVDKRNDWENITRSHAARKTLHSLLDDADIEPMKARP